MAKRPEVRNGRMDRDEYQAWRKAKAEEREKRRAALNKEGTSDEPAEQSKSSGRKG